MGQRNKQHPGACAFLKPSITLFGWLADTLQKSGFLKYMKHRLLHFLHLHGRRRLSDNKNKIRLRRYAVGLMTHDLLYHPSHPVAHDRISDFFARRNTEAKWIRVRLLRPIYDKLPVGERFAASIDPAEISAVTQTQLSVHDLWPPFFPSFNKYSQRRNDSVLLIKDEGFRDKHRLRIRKNLYLPLFQH